jgi:hypothetical protein
LDGLDGALEGPLASIIAKIAIHWRALQTAGELAVTAKKELSVGLQLRKRPRLVCHLARVAAFRRVLNHQSLLP